MLIVTKMDRLGRNAMDVTATVDRLAKLGVRVYCLALGGADLTSAAGRMTMQVINAVAQFERDLLIERTNSGLARAKAAGEKLGRPRVLDDKRAAAALAALQAGATVSAVAQQFSTSRQTNSAESVEEKRPHMRCNLRRSADLGTPTTSHLQFTRLCSAPVRHSGSAERQPRQTAAAGASYVG